MSIGQPGGMNTYVPTLELSGNLMVSYARNLDAYPVNRYAKVTPVKQVRGAYLRFDPLSLARLTNLPYSTHWAPGSLRPTGFANTLGFEQKTFQTERENFSSTLDKRSVDLANWPILKAHTEALAQRAMTWKTWRVTSKMFDSTQYDATHVVTATTASGSGFLSAGTTADPRIKIALDYAARLIQKDTMGSVRFGNLSVLMNATTALRLSQTRELREYLMQQADAIKMIRLDDKNYNAAYGLPKRMYNYNLIVEDTFYNTSNQGASAAAAVPVVPDNKLLVFLSDDGDMEKPDALAPSYNTCHVFAYEEMSVETFDDARHRLMYMDIVMDLDVQIVAPPTGVLVTNVFS